MKMTEFQKEIIHIAQLMAYTLCFVILSMTFCLLGGLFMPNSVIDNKDIFPIIAPAFSTIIGGFIGWLAAIKLNNASEEEEKDEPVA
jgi:drug/metabolite transporter (DMT)-like permease